MMLSPKTVVLILDLGPHFGIGGTRGFCGSLNSRIGVACSNPWSIESRYATKAWEPLKRPLKKMYIASGVAAKEHLDKLSGCQLFWMRLEYSAEATQLEEIARASLLIGSASD